MRMFCIPADELVAYRHPAFRYRFYYIFNPFPIPKCFAVVLRSSISFYDSSIDWRPLILSRVFDIKLYLVRHKTMYELIKFMFIFAFNLF